MKGIYWNSRGLLDLAKYRYILEAIREHNLDFVAVMETGKKDMSRANLNRLSGGASLKALLMGPVASECKSCYAGADHGYIHTPRSSSERKLALSSLSSRSTWLSRSI